MQTQSETVDILHDDFEAPVTHEELRDLIYACIVIHGNMPVGKKETTQYRNKLNDLIHEYNDMRGMVLINKI